MQKSLIFKDIIIKNHWFFKGIIIKMQISRKFVLFCVFFLPLFVIIFELYTAGAEPSQPSTTTECPAWPRELLGRQKVEKTAWPIEQIEEDNPTGQKNYFLKILLVRKNFLKSFLAKITTKKVILPKIFKKIFKKCSKIFKK